MSAVTAPLSKGVVVNANGLTAEQLERLRRIAVDGPLVVGTRTTERVIGESGVRSLERRGLVLRFTVTPRHISGMVRITDDGRRALEAADCRLRLFDAQGALQCT